MLVFGDAESADWWLISASNDRDINGDLYPDQHCDDDWDAAGDGHKHRDDYGNNDCNVHSATDAPDSDTHAGTQQLGGYS